MMTHELLTDLETTSKETVKEIKEKASGAMDNYFDFLEKSISSCPTGGTQFGEKLKSYSEQNLTAARDYVHKLSQAKDLMEVVRVQTEFVQSRFNAFGVQSKGLGEACAKAAADVMNKPFKKVA